MAMGEMHAEDGDAIVAPVRDEHEVARTVDRHPAAGIRRAGKRVGDGAHRPLCTPKSRAKVQARGLDQAQGWLHLEASERFFELRTS